jgi:hypothetical protein
VVVGAGAVVVGDEARVVGEVVFGADVVGVVEGLVGEVLEGGALPAGLGEAPGTLVADEAERSAP